MGLTNSCKPLRYLFPSGHQGGVDPGPFLARPSSSNVDFNIAFDRARQNVRRRKGFFSANVDDYDGSLAFLTRMVHS